MIPIRKIEWNKRTPKDTQQKSTENKLSEPFSLQQISDILMQIDQRGQSSALHTIFEPFSDKYVTECHTEDTGNSDTDLYMNEKAFINDSIQSNQYLLSKDFNAFNGLSDEEIIFFADNIKVTNEKCVEICTNEQTSNTWFNERKHRITASKCYSLFTYSFNKSADWDNKINSYLNPKELKHPNLEFGRQNEKNALLAYTTETNKEVTHFGLFVHPSASWMGCSPDGIVINDGLLIEIKCPVKGKDLHFKEFIEQINYLKLIDDTYFLKKKHIYYGQIQLSLCITNLRKCDLVLYCKKDDKCLIVRVDYDSEFVISMVNVLQTIYFKYFLPKISMVN